MINDFLKPVFAAVIIFGVNSACYAQGAKLSDPIIGTADASGDLALHVFSPGAKNPNIARLSTDYGVVMSRTRDGGALFVLGSRATKTVSEFTSYESFVDALGALPPKSVITIYDRCTVPRFYDFYPVHDELLRKFTGDCVKRKLRIAKDPQVICSCNENG